MKNKGNAESLGNAKPRIKKRWITKLREDRIKGYNSIHGHGYNSIHGSGYLFKGQSLSAIFQISRSRITVPAFEL